MREIIYKPIGVIHSPFESVAGTPIQPTGARGVAATFEVFDDHCAALKDIEGFSYIILLCHLHLAKGFSLEVKLFMDNESFRRWLTDTVFGLTYESSGAGVIKKQSS